MTTKPKNKRRGSPKSGRKPVADPKVQVSFYCESSIIEANGKMEAVRNHLYEYLVERAKNIHSKKTES